MRVPGLWLCKGTARAWTFAAIEPAINEPEVAWPIVRESTRFFTSMLDFDSGVWSINHTPSMGQDEFGGVNAKNYLDSLYSAEYCLRTAISLNLELGMQDADEELWNRILSDGLAFERLRDPATGLLMTCEAPAGSWRPGGQKHPVQLNPLVFSDAFACDFWGSAKFNGAVCHEWIGGLSVGLAIEETA